MTLKDKIKNKEANIGIIGLGYVGLPLAITSSLNGYRVTGIDTDKKKIINILMGRSYIRGVADEKIVKAINSGGLTVTHNIKRIKSMDVLVICVPTPLDNKDEPDVSYIKEVVKNIKKYAEKNCLIILESTTYPGTTKELIKDELDKQGWSLNRDYNLCFSPEREDPGNELYNVQNTPKVVGGMSKECTELGVLFYSAITNSVIPVSSTTVAEMAKLLENTFRFINIALINEMSIICDKMGINIWEAISAASSKPFGFMPFYPGPGVGGHCIPIDPIYFNWKARDHKIQSEMIELSKKINENMPKHVVDSVINRMQNDGIYEPKILIVGIAYKKDIDDVRESPAIDIIENLIENNGVVDFYDPYVKELKVKDVVMHSVDYTNENLDKYDCVVVVTNHSEINFSYILEKARLIYDTRNSFGVSSEKIITLGGGLCL